ncbi:MAG TPA: DNA polymerase III subunit delta' [Anaerolineaceae bacterium]
MNWDMLGHAWAIDQLKEQIVQDRLRHAYLFTGPPGVGRRSLALRFAQAINCQNPPAPGMYCGKCRSCTLLESFQHPDLSIVQSDQEGTDLKIDKIRELQRRLSLSPYEARYRVALLLRFQEANDNAQNALLKTLEEAPEKVILLLTADTAESLLPTIVSRCEVLRLRPLPLETVQASLRARGIPAERAELAAHISGGRPGYAIRLSQDGSEMLDQRQEWLEALWDQMHSSRVKRFQIAAALTASKGGSREDRDAVREKLRGALLTWLPFWRDVMLRCAGASSPLTNPDQAERIERVAAGMELSAARGHVAALEDGLARLPNANLLLLVETLLLGLPRLG